MSYYYYYYLLTTSTKSELRRYDIMILQRVVEIIKNSQLRCWLTSRQRHH